MRSPLCARSCTFRAIFRPWNPIGPNRYSLGGWVPKNPAPSPFLIRSLPFPAPRARLAGPADAGERVGPVLEGSIHRNA